MPGVRWPVGALHNKLRMMNIGKKCVNKFGKQKLKAWVNNSQSKETGEQVLQACEKKS